MMKFNFKARDAAGKWRRFNVIEPSGMHAYRYAYDRAQKIAQRMGWTDLVFA